MCGGSFLAYVVKTEEQRGVVWQKDSFVVYIVSTVYVWKWSKGMKWIILSIYEVKEKNH